jgi:hypothetical protein
MWKGIVDGMPEILKDKSESFIFCIASYLLFPQQINLAIKESKTIGIEYPEYNEVSTRIPFPVGMLIFLTTPGLGRKLSGCSAFILHSIA